MSKKNRQRKGENNMRKSVWQEVSLPSFPKLQGTHSTDVLVIGGGMCGLLCAWFLKHAGIDTILVEGKTIAGGVTGNTTAKITFQHGLIYDRLLREVGREKAGMYLQANRDALQEYQELCSRIPCDFEVSDSYVYSLEDRQKIEDEVKAVNTLGFPAEFCQQPGLPFSTKGAIRFRGQAQFHPLKFLAGIAGKLNIYENTFIRKIAGHTAWAEEGTIRARKIVVATHFPFLNRHGSYYLKLYQHRSYVSAYEHAMKLDGMYVDEKQTGLSLRNYGDLLLVGGGSHRTGKQGSAWEEMHRFAARYFPEARLKYEWATQDCMSLDGIPYIGNYSAKTPDLYVATGFNKWGMTGSMVSARILCDMVQEKKNKLAQVFSPHRSMLKPQLFFNGLEAGMNFLTPTVRRCPHLGCALKWNPAEHTWDCPCHGSRFEENGSLIDNPATGDAKGNKFE